jgi:hypothetical protein
MHLSLSNDLCSNLLKCPIGEFSGINSINNSIQSRPAPLIIFPSQTPTTPNFT